MNLETLTTRNSNYRKVVKTTKQMQLVLMSLKPKEFIPLEKHDITTQFIRVEKGKALIQVGKTKKIYSKDDYIIIPPGKKHKVTNIGTTALKLYTIYSPPEHPPKLVQRFKDV